MTDTALSFEAKNNTGNNLGGYELFLDLPQGTNTVTFVSPSGWSVTGIKIYTPTLNCVGKLMPCAGKTRDRATCNSGDFSSVFNSPNTLPQFPLNDNVVTDTNNVGADTLYAYLIWIQDGSGNNDYIGPGMRNRN
ncbi:MAG: hypothetical protein V7720_17195 [Halioglobus sp.]